MSRIVFLLTVALAAGAYSAIGAWEDDAANAFDRQPATTFVASQKRTNVIRCYAAQDPNGKLVAIPCNPPAMDDLTGLRKLPGEPLAF